MELVGLPRLHQPVAPRLRPRPRPAHQSLGPWHFRFDRPWWCRWARPTKLGWLHKTCPKLRSIPMS